MKIRSLGQSCFLITLKDGAVLITDPWLGPHFLKTYPAQINPETLHRCDGMLTSHYHMDHLDATALRMARRLGTSFAGSLRAARKAVRAGVRDVVSMRPGESANIAGVVCHAVHATHPLAPDAIGFVIEADKTLYFSGDTRYSEGIAESVRRFKPDIALLQASCAVYFGKKDGMDMPDAAKFARRVGAPVAIPMHYHDRFRHPDPAAFVKALEGADVRADILKLGEEKEY